MEFRSRIEEGLKKSLKEKDSIRVSVLRMLLTGIKNKEVEKLRPLTEDEFFSIVKTSIKQHNESIESFKKGNRTELAQKEERELEVLKEFLPAPLSEEELLAEIDEAIKILEARSKRDMGKVIKLLMDKFPGRTDGKVLSEMVLKKLSAQ